jgi:hypothetical protein
MKRFAFIALVACSGPPSPSPGLEGPTVESSRCAPRDTNPYGVCYPTTNLGTGGGQVIANYCFDDGSLSFCLAQLYDPQKKFPARLIHLTVIAVWCGPCNEYVDFIAGTNVSGANTSGVSWAKDLAPDVVFIDILADGKTPGVGPTTNDLQAWIAAHGDVVPTFLDPGVQNLGVFYDGAAIPFSIDIDPHTMTIIDATEGFDTNLDQTLKTLLASMK